MRTTPLGRVLLGLMAGMSLGVAALAADSAEANGYNSFTYYVKSDNNHKLYRQMELGWGNWICNFGICSLPMNYTEGYANIINTQYYQNHFASKRSAPGLGSWMDCGEDEYFDYWSTPHYFWCDLWDYVDSGPVYTTSVACNNGYACMVGGGAFIKLEIPFNTNSVSVSSYGIPTSYP